MSRWRRERGHWNGGIGGHERLHNCPQQAVSRQGGRAALHGLPRTQLGVCCLATHLLLCAHDNRACAQACDAAHAALSAAGAALQAGETAALLAFRGSVVGPDKPFRGGQDEAVWSAHKDALVASLATYASRTAPPGLEVAGGVTPREWECRSVRVRSDARSR